MKSPRLVVIFVLACCCTLAVAEEPKPYDVLIEARKLAREGKYEESLKKHLWYHDNALRLDRGQGGVRLSFALSDWAELGKQYPKAMDAMLQIRDKKTKEVELGVGSFDAFHDVFAINHQLNQKAKSIELFKFIDKHQPETASICFHVISSELVGNREYAMCSKYITDPLADWEQIKTMRELHLSLKKDDPEMKAFAENTFVQETAELIEILTGAGRGDEAAKVKEQVLAVVDNAKIREAIDKGIARAKSKAS
jgi:hypothetical protein